MSRVEANAPKEEPAAEFEISVRYFADFFSKETDGRVAALFRIGIGLMALNVSANIWLNLDRFYRDSGLMPWRFVSHFPEQKHSFLSLAPTSDALVTAVGIGMLVSAVCVVIGLVPRIALGFIFFAAGALNHRNPYVQNGGDHLFVLLCGVGTCLPLARAWSVHSYLRALKGTAPPPTTVWSQRLLSLHVCYIYLFAFGAKIWKPGWHNGDALTHALASPALAEWPVELTFRPLLLLMAWGTLLFEMLFPVLVFRPRFRNICLLLGIGFHVSIELLFRIPLFSSLMILSYVSFLTDADVGRMTAWAQRLMGLRTSHGRAA